ncbi:hypothetical protein B0H21DRAFT_706537 [Amylocystis lapponica]|nr:hypothetical protein B0H21DRAFT_706537 [Amylocystis lapponica]
MSIGTKPSLLPVSYRVESLKSDLVIVIVRAELHSIQGNYAHYTEDEPKAPRVPCPFTAFLLAIAWNVDLDTENGLQHPSKSNEYFGDSLLEASTRSWGRTNDDGISVIDVTDPEAPKYCLVLNRDREPITAEEYVRRFPVPPRPDEFFRFTDEDDTPQVVNLMRGEEMITLSMLAEAWPDEYEDVGVAVADTSEEASFVTAANTPALAHAIESGDTGNLEELLWLPGKAGHVVSILREMSPFPDAALPLLLKALLLLDVQSSSLDMSGYHFLPSQFSHVLSAHKDLSALNLAYNPYVTADTVREVLTAVPGLKRLVIMECPSITSTALYRLMRSEPALFTRLEALMHLALLTLDEPPRYPTAFTYASIRGHHYALRHGLIGCSIPFLAPTTVVRTLTDYLGTIWTDFRYQAIGLAAQAALSGVRAPGTPWGERSVVSIPAYAPDVFMDAQPGWAFVSRFDETAGTWWESGRGAFLRFTPVAEARALGEEWKSSGEVEAREADASGTDGHERDATARRGRRFECSIHSLRSFVRVMSEEEGYAAVPEADIVKL